MPVTPFSDDDEGMPDWLQALFRGGAGQQGPLPFPGAAMPYGPGGIPRVASAGPGGVMPGGGALNFHAATAGAPSLGYPATQSPFPPGAPAQPPAARGYSGLFTGANPLVQFGGFHPENIVNPQDVAALKSQVGSLFGGGAAAAPMDGAPPQGPPGYLNSTSAVPPAGNGGAIGSDANFPVMGAGGFPTTYAAPGQQPAAPIAPRAAGGGRTRTSPASTATAPPAGPVRTPGAPNLGYYQGDRFKTLQYDVAGTPGATQMPGGAGRAGQNRNPYITALNLGSLFGGGQPNPANVPSAAAQPVSATQGGGTIDLPTNYNLPGSGYYMTPGGDVRGTRYPQDAGATPTLGAYQQWLRARGVRV
jgi:hypothetical protein